MAEHSKDLPKIDFAALNAALLHQIVQLLGEWLPKGNIGDGSSEYVAHSVWRTEKTPSLKVSVSGINMGKWSDFGGDQRGKDLISLYAAIHGMEMGAAAVELAHQHGLERVANVVSRRPGDMPARPPPPPAPPREPAEEKDAEKWDAQPCAPSHAHPAIFANDFRKDPPEHVARYVRDGVLYGYVARFIKSDGRKLTLPYVWATSKKDGSSKWVWKTWPEPRPLFFPSAASPGQRTVVLVEGEKKADVLHGTLQAGAPDVYCVASWQGGANGWKKADWSWLAGCHVLLWPDCDSKREKLTKKEEADCVDDAALAAARAAKPLLPPEKQVGMAAMLGIGARLRDEHACTVQILPIPAPGEVVDGWDCADAINADGWGFDRVMGFFGQAQPLIAPAVPPSAPQASAGGGGGGGGKKIDRPADAREDDGERPWWLKPYWDADKGRWLVSRKLVIKALTHDEHLQGMLGINLLSSNIEARRAWPWPHAKAGPITGAIDLLLGQYLSDSYGLPSINRAALSEAVETVAHQSPFHPVRDYVEGLEHDGKARIDKWLIYVIGETPETLGPAMTEYLTLVGRFWLLGMVNRVMDPGCKFDYCPVLEGPGGMLKSTLVEVLASSAWFSDTHFDVSKGKDGQEQVQGLWVYEIAELANFGKSEINIIKAFISAKVDRYRPSYGRVVESYARQCVLVGTTNEKTYLRDRTGNRRFWPVPVRHRINIAWVTKWRDQLMAEAYARYLTGERFNPTPEEEDRLFKPVQESRLVDTAVLSELLYVLTRPPMATGIAATVNELTEFVTLSQLTMALGVDAAKSNAGLESQIRSWMDHEGWERIKKQVNGVRSWGYARPKNWPKNEDEPAGQLQPQAMHEGADDEPF